MRNKICLLFFVSVLSLTAYGNSVEIDITAETLYTLGELNTPEVIISDEVLFYEQDVIDRPGLYGFEGEQVKYRVMVYDKDGRNDIDSVEGFIYSTFSCVTSPDPVQGTMLSNLDYPTVFSDKDYYDQSTMVEYICVITITSEIGNFTFFANATDSLDESTGLVSSPNKFYANPSLMVGVDGLIYFPDMHPGKSSDTTLSVLNEGSVAHVSYSLKGTDFYGGTGVCPTSNVLELSNLEYSAQSVYGDVFNKVINYNYAPVYSSGQAFAPDETVDLVFTLNLPNPCQGEFGTGSIYLSAEAI